MAKATDVMEQVSSGGGALMKPGTNLNQLLARVDIKKRFEEILGQKAAGFMSSIMSLTSADQNLRACDPKTILSAAVLAATLDLPINKNLGFAWIIPYKGKAEFQMGYKGFVQLAIRSGQYETMNAAEIYEDEIKTWNPITGEIEFTPTDTWKYRYEGKAEKVIGYVAFFKLLNGFRKYIYMTKGQIETHARRYAQSFENPRGKWKTDRDAMSKKTVLKLLLSKYGVLSIEMQRAIKADQGVILDAGKDKTEEPSVEFIDTEAVETDEQKAAVPAASDEPEGVDPAEIQAQAQAQK